MRRDTLKTIVISAAILGMLSLGSWAAASPDKALEASEEIDPYAWQAVEPLARNTIERESASRSIAGVLLTTPDPTLSGAPGTQVTYPVTLENQTASDEVFTLDYTGNTWTATGPADTGLVADGGTFVFDVLVTIPAGLDDCMVDTVQITATSVSTPADNATLDLFTETAATVLFDNGPFMNSPGTGVGGADESVLQNTSLGMTTIGFGHQVTSDNRIADDFTVTDAAGWQVDRIVFYAYQTNAPNVSTITAVNYQIWDGPPDDPGSSVVFGDTATNRMASTEWTGVYRVTEDTTGGNTARAIFATTCDAGVLLPQGTYWLDWQADGDAAYSGPWIMPVTINGQTTTGNAMQYTSNSGNWGPAQDGGTLTGQDFPFLLLECAAAPVCPYTITVSPATIPTPVIDIPYSVTFTATGGVAPYAFSVAAGTLPDGLTLDPVTGELSGTPTTDADYTFTIMATDDDGCTGTLEYTVSTGAYDLILFDDAGRAWACVNSATGDWSWTDAQTVQTFTGTGLISLRNGVMNIVSMPGEPWSLTIRVYTRFGIAYGSFIYRAFRIRSSLNDRDILNNPDFCN